MEGGNVKVTLRDKKKHRIREKKFTRIEQKNLMFSLKYYTKPKINFFLGHPVVGMWIWILIWFFPYKYAFEQILKKTKKNLILPYQCNMPFQISVQGAKSLTKYSQLQ